MDRKLPKNKKDTVDSRMKLLIKGKSVRVKELESAKTGGFEKI
jgi:hypothetical protein